MLLCLWLPRGAPSPQQKAFGAVLSLRKAVSSAEGCLRSHSNAFCCSGVH